MLEEEFAYSVSDSFPIAGLAVSPSRIFLLWSPRHSYVMVVSPTAGSTIVAHPTLVRPVAVAFVQGDSVSEVIDGYSKSVLRLTVNAGRAARMQWQRSLQVPFPVQTGVRTATRWFLAGRTDDSTVVVAAIAEGEAPEWVRRVRSLSGREPMLRTIQLAVHDSLLVITAVGAPFKSLKLTASGRVVGSLDPLASPSVTLGRGGRISLEHWVALPVVSLDRGALQTIADLRSDTRVLLLYDHSGRVTRQTVLDAPLGFMARVPGTQIVVGARRLNTVELVGYSWHWSRNP